MKTGRRMNFSKRTKLVLIGLAVAVVLILRLAPGSGRNAEPSPGNAGAVAVDTGSSTSAGDPAATTNPALAGSTPAGGDQGDGDDGVADPTLVQPTPRPDTTEAATQFAAAWLNTYQRSPENWRAGLATHVTPDLATDLDNADPATVPAGAKTGQVTVDQVGDLPIATAPIITDDGKRTPLGKLKLTLVHHDNDWLVSEIDWEPRR